MDGSALFAFRLSSCNEINRAQQNLEAFENKFLIIDDAWEILIYTLDIVVIFRAVGGLRVFLFGW